MMSNKTQSSQTCKGSIFRFLLKMQLSCLNADKLYYPISICQSNTSINVYTYYVLYIQDDKGYVCTKLYRVSHDAKLNCHVLQALVSPNGLLFCFEAKTHCQRCCHWHPCTTNGGPLAAGARWLLLTGFLGSSNVKSQEHLNLTTRFFYCSLYALTGNKMKYNTINYEIWVFWTTLKWSRHTLDYTFREKKGYQGTLNTKHGWTRKLEWKVYSNNSARR